MTAVLVTMLRLLVNIGGVLIIAGCSAAGMIWGIGATGSFSVMAVGGGLVGAVLGIPVAALLIGTLAVLLEMRDFLEELCKLVLEQKG